MRDVFSTRLLAKAAGSRWARELRAPTGPLGHVLVLAGWTAAAQFLYLLALPILSRLYSVESFGNLAVLQSISAFTAVAAALRYDIAITLPEDDETAINLLGLSLVAVAATTGLIVLLAMALPTSWVFQGQLAFLRGLWWLIPLTHFGSGVREAVTCWAIRRKSFPAIAKTKVGQVVLQLLLQLGMGFGALVPFGLYIGDAVGRIGGAGSLLRELRGREKTLLSRISRTSMLRAGQTYRSFPIFSIWAQLLSRSGRDFVPVAMASLYGAVAAGWFALASRVVAAPLELIARSVAQVYLAEASELCRRNPVELKRLFQKSAQRLLLTALLPGALIAVLGPRLFEIAFGQQWSGAGVYARCMAIMLVAQFVNFPLVHTLNILERQTWQLLWDAAVLATGLGGIVALQHLGVGDVYAVLYYSSTMAIMFALHYFITLIAIDQRIEATRITVARDSA